MVLKLHRYVGMFWFDSTPTWFWYTQRPPTTMRSTKHSILSIITLTTFAVNFLLLLFVKQLSCVEVIFPRWHRKSIKLEGEYNTPLPYPSITSVARGLNLILHCETWNHDISRISSAVVKGMPLNNWSMSYWVLQYMHDVLPTSPLHSWWWLTWASYWSSAAIVVPLNLQRIYTNLNNIIV